MITKEKPKQTPPPPNPTSVYLSSPCYCFEAGFSPLYLQPSANNLDYAAEAEPFDFAVPNPALSPNWIIYDISPGYHFGFDAEIAAIFHGVNSRLSLDWERFHMDNESNAQNVPSVDMIGPFFEIGPDASFYKKSTGYVNFHFEEINLDYGTLVNFGNRLSMELFSGVSFSRIIQYRKTHFADYQHAAQRTIKVPSKFWGIGPQIGVDFAYRIIEGLKFIGNTKASLYVGRLWNKTTYSTTSNELNVLGGPNPNIQTTTVYNRAGVVPGFEGMLGFAYDIPFLCNYLVKLEAGYLAQIYLNAIRSIDMGSEVSLTGAQTGATGVYARTFQRTVSDFALAGAYFNIEFGF